MSEGNSTISEDWDDPEVLYNDSAVITAVKCVTYCTLSNAAVESPASDVFTYFVVAAQILIAFFAVLGNTVTLAMLVAHPALRQV